MVFARYTPESVSSLLGPPVERLEVRVPTFSSVVYFSRGAFPPKRGEKGT